MSPSDFDPEQLRRGIEHEMEHTDDPEIAQEIAMDHLAEDHRYYDHLDAMEQQAFQANSILIGSIRHFSLILTGLLTQYDMAEERRELKRGGRGNIYRLGHLLKASQEAFDEVASIADQSDGRALEAYRVALQGHFVYESPRLVGRRRPSGEEPEFALSPLRKLDKMMREWVETGKRPKYPVQKPEQVPNRAFEANSKQAPKSIVGRYSGMRWTARWVELPGSRVDNHWAYAGPDGKPGCWSYSDDRGYGHGLGYAADRHATPEAALVTAAERDVLVAAQGDNSLLSRAAYESEASRLGLETWSDNKCEAMIGGDWDLPTYGVSGAAARTLAVRRGREVERMTSQRGALSAQDPERAERIHRIAELEERAQDAEDREDLDRAWKLRAQARALGQHIPNSGYYVWPIASDGVTPLSGEGPYGPHDLQGAKTYARIAATQGAHNRAVSRGLDPKSPSFEIVRVYRHGTGERMV